MKHGYSNAAIDYRHWGVPLSRRFRSLKLWYVCLFSRVVFSSSYTLCISFNARIHSFQHLSNIVPQRFVIRNYGISGIRAYIRRHIKLAQRFECHVLKDKRFEICNEVKVNDSDTHTHTHSLKFSTVANIKSIFDKQFPCTRASNKNNATGRHQLRRRSLIIRTESHSCAF